MNERRSAPGDPISGDEFTIFTRLTIGSSSFVEIVQNTEIGPRARFTAV